MEETSKSGMSWASIILGIIVLVFIFGAWGGNGFFGGRGYGPGFAAGVAADGCGRTSNCEVERRGLITAADTNYRIIEQAQATRETVQATASATQAKIDFYAYQDLRDKLAEQQRQNMMLQNQIYSDAKFNALSSQLANIQCKMLKRPDVSGLATSCNPIVTPFGIYAQNLNGSCGCGCGTSAI